MSDEKSKPQTVPLREGYVVKGGVNTTSKISTRPPKPAPMKPAQPQNTNVAKP